MDQLSSLHIFRSACILIIVSSVNGAVPRGEFRDAKLLFSLDDQPDIWEPWVSEDGLRIYFSDGFYDASEIAVAERATLNDPFGAPVHLPSNVNIDPSQFEGNVFLMDDERTMLFESESAGPPNDNFLIAKRDNLESSWNDPSPFTLDFFEEMESTEHVEFTKDQLSLYFTGKELDAVTSDVFVSRRESVNDPFVSYDPLAGVATDEYMEVSQTVSSDQLAVFFRSNQDADFGAFELWAAFRDSIDDEFSEPQKVEDLWPDSGIDREGIGEGTPYLSRDWPSAGSKLYYGSGDFSKVEFYEATWYPEIVVGDVTGDYEVTVHDLDQIALALRAGDVDPIYDLNSDSLVNHDDFLYWVSEIKNTWIGDSDLDGEFNSTDFLKVFQAGEYEDELLGNSTWATGDWNGDGDFNTIDFIVAFQDGGYEQGLRSATNSVPEPTGLTSILVLLAVLAGHARNSFTIGREA